MATVCLTSNTSWYLYNFRRSTLQALIAQGDRVVCLSPPDAFSQRLIEELGVEHIPLWLNGKSTNPLHELRSLFAIWKNLRQIRPDVVLNYTVKMNLYSGLCCRALGMPFANNVSGLGTAFLHQGWLFRLVRKAYGWVNAGAQRVFFQNVEDQAVFADAGMLGNVPVTLLPGSGVNVRHFQPAPMPDSPPMRFLMIARLLGDKGVREYAAAAKKLQANGVDATCQLIGPLGVSNRTAITEPELHSWTDGGWIQYLGETDDVRPFLANCHVLVLPSYREGMPRTVLEAAAMARPAIVTDVPGCRSAVVAGETGWLCQVRDADSLAQRMRECVDMPLDELPVVGNRARVLMEQEFDESIVVTRTLECVDEVMQQH